MENLNAEQIIKALELCKDVSYCVRSCKGICPYENKTDCVSDLAEDALSLIKELTEENGKLMSTSSLQGAIIGNLQAAANELTTDKERLEKLIDDKCDRCIERERADTVREMQERFLQLLEKEHRLYTPEGADYMFKNGSIMMWSVAERVFRQIAKEMVEGE